ncbi:hypothetical protein QOZ80_5AG0383920 [Eleusine coracana subsp. coracana]|nr:hypothetical protein QOZ80_5AG0383920 [Eleusine coracana subsp. coracana]
MSISVALFKRSRGRESSTSARSLIRRRAGGGSSLMARCRRAGGGSSLMARCNSRRRVAGRFLLPQLAPRREDRLSALSDDLLLLILRRVDGRAAFCAGTLSRRWAHLPRELTALDLKVGDTLPPRYHRMVRLYLDLYSKRQIALYQPLLPSLNRYERRAMRVFAGSVESFLEGPRRKVDRMNLEFFITGNAGCVNRLIAEAIDAWGVEDLEVIAKPIYKQPDVHTFPSHGLCKEPRASRLQSLKLAHCVPPPLHGYRALTVLVLRDIPASTTPSAAYEDIFTWCLQLNTVHLISCSIFKDVVVDAPGSEIRELVVDKCSFSCLRLRALPCLESIASIRRTASPTLTEAQAGASQVFSVYTGHNEPHYPLHWA